MSARHPVVTLRRRCGLAASIGREESCAPSCPFWEPGGAVLEGGCVLERSAADLADAETARVVLELRTLLAASDEARHRASLHRLLRLDLGESVE